MDLLKHPVTESFLHLKNTQVGWLYLASNLAFYLTFLLSITGLIFTNHSSWFITVLAGSQTAAHTTFLSLTLVCLVLFILIEIFKVIVIFDIEVFFKRPVNELCEEDLIPTVLVDQVELCIDVGDGADPLEMQKITYFE